MFLYKSVIRNSEVNSPLRCVFEQDFMCYCVSRILHPDGVLEVTFTTQVLLNLTIHLLNLLPIMKVIWVKMLQLRNSVHLGG